jgi:hypothetical protein
MNIKRLQNLLCVAFEGGMSNWAMVVKKNKPTEIVNRFDDEEIYKLYDYPANPGGSIEVVDLHAEEELDNAPPMDILGRYNFKGWTPKTVPMKLDLEALQRGVKVMHEKYPRHYADALSENDDAITGDVFLQCCLFGDAIYG